MVDTWSRTWLVVITEIFSRRDQYVQFFLIQVIEHHIRNRSDGFPCVFEYTNLYKLILTMIININISFIINNINLKLINDTFT